MGNTLNPRELDAMQQQLPPGRGDFSYVGGPLQSAQHDLSHDGEERLRPGMMASMGEALPLGASMPDPSRGYQAVGPVGSMPASFPTSMTAGIGFDFGGDSGLSHNRRGDS